jgi:indolepyruvate ferredoxin oxidoreductase beta subunit
MKFNILISGVGGQGVILAGNLIAEAALASGIHVITGEAHGMAQRGGSVSVHLRMGDVRAPLIPLRNAEVLLGFEPAETLRYIEFLKPGGTVIMNENPVVPPGIFQKGGTYPAIGSIEENIRTVTKSIFRINAEKLAMDAGNPLTVNTVMLGTLARVSSLPFGTDILLEVIKKRVPEKAIEANVMAFQLGYDSFSV